MLPSFLKPIFWSYKFSELDKKQHRRLIITQILAYGNIKMIRWLLKNYPLQEILTTLKKSGLKEWDPKSYFFWQTILS